MTEMEAAGRIFEMRRKAREAMEQANPPAPRMLPESAAEELRAFAREAQKRGPRDPRLVPETSNSPEKIEFDRPHEIHPQVPLRPVVARVQPPNSSRRKIIGAWIEGAPDDAIEVILREIRAQPAWGTRKKAAFQRLLQAAQDEGYTFFAGDFRTYGLPRMGDSALYRVPQGCRGALRRFAGKTVRVACIGYIGHHAARKFMAKDVEVGQTVGR